MRLWLLLVTTLLPAKARDFCPYTNVSLHSTPSVRSANANRPSELENKKLDSFAQVGWYNGEIVYEFSSSNPVLEETLLLDTFRYFEEKTCLRFYDIDSAEAASMNPYSILTLQSDGNAACWSYVGPQPSRTYLNLGVRGCFYFDISSHEVLHAMGMPHHHSRFDRDNFMIMHWDRIPADVERNFWKWDLGLLAVYTQYDFSSVMHYSTTAFGSGRITIEPKLSDPDLLGSVEGDVPSHYDLLSVNAHYQCASHCPSSLRCEHDGFVDQDCRCACPAGLAGATCEQIDTSGTFNTPGCGGFYRVMGSPGDSYTLNRVSGDDAGVNCAWIFTSEPGNVIEITFSTIEVEKQLELRYNYPGQKGVSYYRYSSNSLKKRATSNNDYRRKPVLSVLMREPSIPTAIHNLRAQVTVSQDATMPAPHVSTGADEDWADLFYEWQTSRSPYDKVDARSRSYAVGGGYTFVISPTTGQNEYIQTNAMWDGTSIVCVGFDYRGQGAVATPFKVQSIERDDSLTVHDTINDNSQMWISHTVRITRTKNQKIDRRCEYIPRIFVPNFSPIQLRITEEYRFKVSVYKKKKNKKNKEGWFGVRFTLGPGTSSSDNFYLDNIDIQACGASGFSTSRPPAPAVAYQTHFHTSFEDESEFRSWIMSGNRAENWKLWTGSSPSGGTGPSGAAEGQSYLLFEASGTLSGDTATATPDFKASGNEELCLAFDYHFYGSSPGTLSLRRINSQTHAWTQLWAISGAANSMDTWRNLMITLPPDGVPYRVAFHAESIGSYRSDFALDNLQISLCPAFGSASTAFWRVEISTRLTWSVVYWILAVL